MKKSLKLKRSFLQTASGMKARKVVAILVTTFIIALILFVPAFADDVTTALKNTNNLLFDVIRLIGVAVLGWGLYELGTSFVNHDGAAKWRAVGGIAGGLLIVFAKGIIAAIGVSTS